MIIKESALTAFIDLEAMNKTVLAEL